MRRLFITGIGTGVGKTVVSAVLVKALSGDYWKPVQAGDLDCSDSDKIRELVVEPEPRIHPERFRLRRAASPHHASAVEGVNICLADFVIPVTESALVIEGAGGVYAPLHKGLLMIDLIGHLGAEVIVVSRNYLGSINHTILTIEALRARELPICGIIFSGHEAPETQSFILSHTAVPYLGRIGEEPHFTPQVITRYAEEVRGIMGDPDGPY